MTIVETRPITGGVDTHLDVHVAAALDANGGVLGVESFPTTTAGFAELHAWLCSVRRADRVGVEGTGAYGAGLARFLRGAGVAVVEVDRPNRQARRRHGKSDTVDASRRHGRRCRARRAAWPRPPTATSRRSGCCWSPTAPDATDASSASTSSAISASPPPMSCGNGSAASPSTRLARDAAALRPNPNGDAVVYATKLAMHTLGRRVLDIDADCARLHDELTRSSKRPPRACSSCYGVGVHTAATAARRRRRQRRADPVRGRLRASLRRRPDPRLIRQDRPPPAQPRRQPPSQPRPLAHRVHPHGLRPAHPRLRRTPLAEGRSKPEIMRVLIGGVWGVAASRRGAVPVGERREMTTLPRRFDGQF